MKLLFILSKYICQKGCPCTLKPRFHFELERLNVEGFSVLEWFHQKGHEKVEWTNGWFRKEKTVISDQSHWSFVFSYILVKESKRFESTSFVQEAALMNILLLHLRNITSEFLWKEQVESERWFPLLSWNECSEIRMEDVSVILQCEARPRISRRWKNLDNFLQRAGWEYEAGGAWNEENVVVSSILDLMLVWWERWGCMYWRTDCTNFLMFLWCSQNEIENWMMIHT